jgi:hypothetical protein
LLLLWLLLHTLLLFLLLLPLLLLPLPLLPCWGTLRGHCNRSHARCQRPR